MDQRKIKILLITITVILIGAILGTLYSVTRNVNKKQPASGGQPTAEKKPEPDQAVPSDEVIQKQFQEIEQIRQQQQQPTTQPTEVEIQKQLQEIEQVRQQQKVPVPSPRDTQSQLDEIDALRKAETK